MEENAKNGNKCKTNACHDYSNQNARTSKAVQPTLRLLSAHSTNNNNVNLAQVRKLSLSAFVTCL
jgi:hypothetical protein